MVQPCHIPAVLLPRAPKGQGLSCPRDLVLAHCCPNPPPVATANLWEGAVPHRHKAEDRKTHFLFSALFHALDNSAQSAGPRLTLHPAEQQLPRAGESPSGARGDRNPPAEGLCHGLGKVELPPPSAPPLWSSLSFCCFTNVGHKNSSPRCQCFWEAACV